jgi:hypothetical protein
LGLAAKRTFEDCIALAALVEHKTSMAGRWRKSRYAKVQRAAGLAKAFRVSPGHQKIPALQPRAHQKIALPSDDAFGKTARAAARPSGAQQDAIALTVQRD